MNLDCGMPRVYVVALSFGGFAGPVFTCARLRAHERRGEASICQGIVRSVTMQKSDAHPARGLSWRPGI